MQPADFTELQRNHLVPIGRDCWAYSPPPLPPDQLSVASLWRLTSEADRAIGELAGLGRNLKNPHLLIRPFIRREAVLSSQIEGTQSTQQDLLLFEVNPEQAPAFDAREVHNYVRALDYALERAEKLPVSRRLLCEMHAILMQNVRGQHHRPGEVRQSQNFIGPKGCTVEQATYVPPPVPVMERALDDLFKYIHADRDLPPLIRLALIHYQFEAIHPFDDGNGRLGRLLMTTLLCVERILPQPLLYLSAYFMKHRQAYYEKLLAVSTSGAWDDWVAFVLTGIVEQSRDAVERAGRLWALWEQYRARLYEAKASPTQMRLVDKLFERPATHASIVALEQDVTASTAYHAIEGLEKLGILTEVTGRKRNRTYIAPGIIALLR